jgi:steroid delta-isomerase-like uncharacterized protein
MTRTFAIVCLICSFCFSQAWAASPQEENKTIAKRVFLELYNQNKFEVADQIYAKDFVNHGLHRNIGLKEDQDAARGWKQAFPDLVISVDQTIAEGDLVTVLWSGRGTNTGAGNGIPATGKKVEGRGITIWRIVNGKITEEWSEFDQLGIMQELGLIPSTTQ